MKFVRYVVCSELTEKKRAQEVAEKRQRGDESRRAWESQLHQRQIAQVLIAKVSSVSMHFHVDLRRKTCGGSCVNFRAASLCLRGSRIKWRSGFEGGPLFTQSCIESV